MDKEINYNSRSSFIKKLSWGLVSIFSLGLLSQKMAKNTFEFRNRFKTISIDEAKDEIGKISSDGNFKPEPPPKKH